MSYGSTSGSIDVPTFGIHSGDIPERWPNRELKVIADAVECPIVDVVDAKPVWRLRDTLAALALLAWGGGWTVFALAQLMDGPLAERRTLLELFVLSVGIAGLYVGLGVTVLRAKEVIAWRNRS